MAQLTPAEEAQLAVLRARRGQVVQEIASVSRDLLATQRSIKTLQDRLLFERDQAAKDLFIANITNLQQQERRQTAELTVLNQELLSIDAQIGALQSPRPGLTAQESAGITVQDNAAAADNGARTQNPPTPVQILDEEGELVDIQFVNQPPSNANRPALSNNEELGLVDGASTVGGANPVRTTIQTQPGAASPTDDARQTGTTPNGWATSSDAPGRAAVAEEFLRKIEDKPNLLAKLASMTYTVSIYLLDPDEYSQLLVQNRKVLPRTSSLIIQSGGISQGLTSTGTNGQTDPGEVPGVTTFTTARNPYFDVDFYIDDLQIHNLVAGPAGVGAHTATTLDFTVVEPYGITFLQRLKAAVEAKAGATGTNINQLTQNFLMVIRFYGYNDQGLLISGSTLGVQEIGSDTNSVVEKWIPFTLADITFKVSSKFTEYRVKAIAVDSNVAFGTINATIPFNFEFTSDTVQGLLNGQATLVSAGLDQQEVEQIADGNSAPPPKASAISTKKTYASGLCDALNQHEQQIAKQKGYQIPNRYVIELENVPGLIDAKVARPGNDDKSRSAMNKNQEAAQRYLTSKTSYNKNENNFSVAAGTQIVQLIDLVMRTSSYITSQQNIIFDPKTGDASNQTPVSTVQWYRIRSECRPIDYDRDRRAIAYEIKYIISRYQINDPRNAYFPNARYRGVHKAYEYWFTGLNSEVLDFQVDVNSQFFMTVGNDGKTVEPPPNASYIEQRAFQARPGQTTQPGSNEAGTPAASLADRIYSPIDVAQIKLDILGDPDWIQQSEVFYKGVDLAPFVQDGSVNYDASEVLFSVNFVPVSDYDLSMGIMDAQKKNARQSGPFSAKPQRDVFRATEVHSYFRQGKFTQQINGLITQFADLPQSTSTATITNGTNTNGQTDPGEVPGVTVFSGGSTQTDPADGALAGSSVYQLSISQAGSNPPITTSNNTAKNLDSNLGGSNISYAGPDDDAAGND